MAWKHRGTFQVGPHCISRYRVWPSQVQEPEPPASHVKPSPKELQPEVKPEANPKETLHKQSPRQA